MANDIHIKVTADDDGSFAAIEDKAKASGARAGQGLGDGIDTGVTERTKGTGEKVSKQVGSEVARGLNQTLRDLQLPELDVKADASKALEELAIVRERVHALASDNPTIEVKIRADRATGEIDKLVKSFITEAEPAGQKFGQKMLTNIGEALSTGQSQVIAVAGALAIAAAPAIGATIAGAVVGGVGIGGIAGGVALAAKDPKVQAALLLAKTNIGNELKDAAQPFVDVSVRGVRQIEQAIEGVDFKKIFADSAQNVGPLLDGISTAITGIGHGIQEIEHNGGPAIREIGQGIGGIGQALGDGLAELSHDSKEGASALHELFMVIDGSITGVFHLVDGLSKVYGALEKISGGGPLGAIDAIGSASARVEGKTRSMAQAIVKNSIPALDSYGRQILTDGAALNDLADATNKATDANLGLFGSVTDVAKAEDDVVKSVKANGRTLDANTEKGRANRTALENLGRALQRNTEDYLAINGVGAKSQAVMNSNRAAFQRAAEAMTGSKKAAQELTNALFGIPDRDVYVNVHQVSDGRERVDQSGHRIGGYYAHGGVKGAASGPISAGLTMVGERGPELLDLPPGTSVHTAGDTARMFRQAGMGGHGPMQVILSFDKAGLTGLPAALTETIRAEVRTGGGNVQQYLGVPGA